MAKCEMAIFTHASREIPPKCAISKINAQQVWSKLNSPNRFIFSVMDKAILNIICKDKTEVCTITEKPPEVEIEDQNVVDDENSQSIDSAAFDALGKKKEHDDWANLFKSTTGLFGEYGRYSTGGIPNPPNPSGMFENISTETNQKDMMSEKVKEFFKSIKNPNLSSSNQVHTKVISNFDELLASVRVGLEGYFDFKKIASPAELQK